MSVFSGNHLTGGSRCADSGNPRMNPTGSICLVKATKVIDSAKIVIRFPDQACGNQLGLSDGNSLVIYEPWLQVTLD